MYRKILCILFSILLWMVPSSALAEEYPNEIWDPLSRFASAMEAGNDSEMYTYGSQVIAIMESQPDSHLKKAFLAGKYEQVSRCAERLGYYDKAVELYRRYLPYGEYMGWTDGLLYAKKKIYLLTPYLEVYVQDKAYFPVNYGAKFEPSRGVYFGSVYDNDQRILDFDHDKILSYFPKENSTWLMYLEFGENPRELGRYNRYLTEAKKNRMKVEFAWNTQSSLADIEQYDAYIKDTIDFLDSYGIPIFLRFGAEMNIGANGQNPEAYIKSFRYVASYAKTKQNIAVVWSPHDLGALDRPYAQYYPGDAYVDWIGASLYVGKYFEGIKDHGSQTDPLNTYFVMDTFAHPVMRMTELIQFMQDNDIRKPVLIAECGVAHFTRKEGEDLTDWAKIQMRRMYGDLLLRFPQIKMINYFNVKMEQEVNAYELYSNSVLNDLYNQLVENPYFLTNQMEAAPFGYRPFDGGTTGNCITVSTAGYAPKTLYNSVRYYLDGAEQGEYWATPYPVTFSNLSEGWHSLKAELLDGGEVKQTKEIWFEVQNPISVFINGKETLFPDQNPLLLDHRTLVPARGVFEQMGMQVLWDDEKQEVTVTDQDRILRLVIGEKSLTVNENRVEMDVPAQIINDRTMIPLRAVSEAMNAKVEWQEESRTVFITYHK